MTSSNGNPFSTEHLRVGLRDHAVRSTGITLSAQAVKLFFQIASITILARLLEPADFGLVAMVTIFTGLATTFVDGGLSMATIQRPEITHAQVSNLFWINVALGIGLCLLAVGLAPVLAWMYDESRLVAIMLAMSVAFIIGGLSVQHDALLRRQMRFKAIAAIDVTSMVIGVCGGVATAWLGFGYWALVVMPVTTILIQTCMRWWLVAWWPSLASRGSGVRPLLVFGLNLSGANSVGYFAMNLTPFVISFIGGAQSLGLYNRANTLTQIPSSQLLPPLMNVMQSALARIAEDPPRLRRAIVSLMRKVALLGMFLTISMAVMADWLVALFLGDGWEGAVPIFRMLALFSIVEPVAGFTAITLIAVGNARAVLRWKLITVAILVASLALGSVWGVMGVVAAYALSGVFIRLPLFLAYASRYLPVSLRDFVRALAPALACAGVTLAVLVGLRMLAEPGSPLAGLLIFTPIALAAYLLTALTMKSLRSELLEMVGAVNLLLKRKHERDSKS
ncbi:lipopolysaccharide biosynthesis protein [uncultured Marinobacter sp.]|uniref:lipopolysaccharide biosynthesis protein n=1 Tax=uncultured Marinobacter sp. TaxID=187379 RepID=UPI0030DC0B8B